MTPEKQEIERVHCNQCRQETKHFVVAKRVQRGNAPVDKNNPLCEISVSWVTTYTMLECCGCENVTLRRLFCFSEWAPDEYEEDYYPPPISRSMPIWNADLPDEWRELLKEVYAALHPNSGCLALMGTRTLVELYMNDQAGDVGGFAQKVKMLEQQGLISKPNKIFLETALDAGHAAAHRGHKPEIDELNQVMDIVENLLQGYVLVKTAENLKKKTPARNRKKK